LAFIGSCLLAVFLLLLCVGCAKFVVVPFGRWALMSTFASLAGETGALRTVRQILGYPIVGLLSLQRQARRGDADSVFMLFLVDVCVGVVLSIVVQGFVTTFFTALAVGILAFLGLMLTDV
jgi:hypothetical protein